MMTITHLKRHFDFLEMKESSFKAFTRRFVLQMRENDIPETRFGFTVSKKISKLATERNRLRRQMRNIVRLHPTLQQSYPHHDFVLIARKDALNASYADLVQDFDYLLNHLSKRENNEN